MLHAKLRATGALCLALFVCAGCLTTTRHMQEAQDHFSKASAAERQMQARGYGDELSMLGQSTASTDYRVSLSLLDKEIKSHESALRKERLLGTALVLKAMCHWRLADLEQLGESSRATYTSEDVEARIKEASRATESHKSAAANAERLRIDLETTLKAEEAALKAATAASNQNDVQASAGGEGAVRAEVEGLRSSSLRVDLANAEAELARVTAERDLANTRLNDAIEDDDLRLTLRRVHFDDKLVLGTRDRAMLAALPGLRDHDRGRRADDFDAASKYFSSSLVVVDRAIREQVTPKRHAVGIHLRLGQLKTCRSWFDAAQQMHDTAEARADASQAAQTKAKAIIAELRELHPSDKDLARNVVELEAALGIN